MFCANKNVLIHTSKNLIGSSHDWIKISVIEMTRNRHLSGFDNPQLLQYKTSGFIPLLKVCIFSERVFTMKIRRVVGKG